MGKKSAPKAPKAPDPNAIIGDESKYNRYNVNTPFGSSKWSGTPGQPDYGVTNTISPELQGAVGDVFGSAGKVPQYSSSAPTALPGDVAHMPDAYNAPNYSANDPQYKALENALYQDQSSQFEPVFAQQSRDFGTSMANRGQPSGGEAYDTGFANMSDAQNRARVMAANQATIAGRNAFEQDRSFGQNAADTNRSFANMLNQQNVQNTQNQQGADRGFDLARYQSMLGGNNAAFGQLSSLLGLTPNQSGNPLDITNPYSMNQAGQLAKYQAQLGSNSGQFGDLSNLLGTGLMAWGMGKG